MTLSVFFFVLLCIFFVLLLFCLLFFFFFVFFFFFKQKTAYEMLRSLVGSEMCIRDRYEDEGLMIINKQNGVAVHSGSGVNVGVIEALKDKYNQPIELVHRLDRATSGCLMPVSYTHLTLPTKRIV